MRIQQLLTKVYKLKSLIETSDTDKEKVEELNLSYHLPWLHRIKLFDRVKLGRAHENEGYTNPGQGQPVWRTG